MKGRFVKLIIFLLSSSIVIKAQDFSLGFSLESNAVKINQEGKSLPLYASIFGLRVNSGIDFNKTLSLEARSAVDFGPEYFTGTEIGLLIKYSFADPFYMSAGLINHKVSKMVNSTDEILPWYSNNANLIMPALAVGVSLPVKKDGNGSGRYNIELMYLNAFNKEIGIGSYLWDDGLPHPAVVIMKPLKLAYALKLSIGVSLYL
ncbi:MAG: hypothetical protein ACM3Q2_13190 [Syntrophothermus sp.]